MGLRFEGDKYLLDLLAQAFRFLYANKEHIDEDDIGRWEKILGKCLRLVRNPKSYKTILERATVGQKGLIVPSEKWDNDLDQLTTPEGKLILATGEVQPLYPTDYRRRCTGVSLFDETLLPPRTGHALVENVTEDFSLVPLPWGVYAGPKCHGRRKQTAPVGA